MNYRHAFHAGNHADVLKHAVLALVLEHLKKKPAPFAVLDTHAGAGIYDLTGDAAQRSPEWRDGIGRVWDWPDAPAALAPYMAALRAMQGDTPARYPGSPLLALKLMRDSDRLLACDLHPETAETLRATLKRDDRAHVHMRDGYEALKGLLPPPEKRGLILIDPPYEDRAAELKACVAAIPPALLRFPGATVIWWRPVKSEAEIDRADAALVPAKALRADLLVAEPHLEGPLVGSSLLVLNPPFTLEADLRALLPPLTARLARSPRARWALRRFGA